MIDIDETVHGISNINPSNYKLFTRSLPNLLFSENFLIFHANMQVDRMKSVVYLEKQKNLA